MTDIRELQEKLIDHEKRISELESLLKTKQLTTSRERKTLPTWILGLVISHLNKLKLSELVLIALKFHEKLTREEIIKILKKWRKKGADSLRGGNFSRDLIRTGLITELGKIGKETVYGLTEGGKIEAEKIIKELRSVNELKQNAGEKND